MRLGDLARVSRGIATGSRKLYVMTRAEAKERNLERFVRPALVSARELPRWGDPVIRDTSTLNVVLLASKRDIEEYPTLSEYLGDSIPRIASVHASPVISTYTGVPYFVANPDGLIVTNALYCVRPRQSLGDSEIFDLVLRLNDAAAKLPRTTGARYSPRALEKLNL